MRHLRSCLIISLFLAVSVAPVKSDSVYEKMFFSPITVSLICGTAIGVAGFISLIKEFGYAAKVKTVKEYVGLLRTKKEKLTEEEEELKLELLYRVKQVLGLEDPNKHEILIELAELKNKERFFSLLSWACIALVPFSIWVALSFGYKEKCDRTEWLKINKGMIEAEDDMRALDARLRMLEPAG